MGVFVAVFVAVLVALAVAVDVGVIVGALVGLCSVSVSSGVWVASLSGPSSSPQAKLSTAAPTMSAATTSALAML